MPPEPIEKNSVLDVPSTVPGAATPKVAPPRSLPSKIGLAMRKEVENFHFRLWVAGILVSFLPSLTFSRLRTAIYRMAGINIGPHSLILGSLTFMRSAKVAGSLSIGAHTIVNGHCFIDLNADVRIGDWVSIGHHVTFITSDHEIGPARCRAGELTPSLIGIEDGCWIGARTTILPGVKIGKSTIVAAGSLVSGSIPGNRLVGGVPARALKVLPESP